MTIDESFGRTIDPRMAELYVRNSLAQGTYLARRLLLDLWSPGVALLMTPPEYGDGRIDPLESGKEISALRASQTAINFFTRLGARSIKTLIVESEIEGRDKPFRGADVAYIGDRIYRWLDLQDNGEEAIQLLWRGSSGYPLNAFLSSQSSGKLGLQVDTEINEEGQLQIINSTQAIVVSAFDGEVFLAWLREDLASEVASSESA
jgi:hypothetical protein